MEKIDGHMRVPKVLYGALFVVILPMALWRWASLLERTVQLPAMQFTFGGAAVMVTGAIVIAVAMLALWFQGGGLPMNAFPPPKFVSTGIYSLVPHPIYGGSVLVCAGVSLLSGSAPGLCLVTPLVAAGSVALVLGFENPDLLQRFGPTARRAWFSSKPQQHPAMIERLRVFLVVLLPWLVFYEGIGWLGPAPDAVTAYMPFERGLPVWQWSEIVYGSAYPVILLAPLLISSTRALRRFALNGIIAMALIFPLYLLLPISAPPRPFVSTSLWGNLLLFERSFSKGAAALPSFHVVWALIAAAALSEPGGRLRRGLWFAWAMAVAISCVTTGMHSIADVAAGIAAYWLIIRMPQLWNALLSTSERIANSWMEWRVGPVRIINHGAYAGAAVMVGICIMSAFLGASGQWLLLAVFGLGTVGAALWAQWVEGSPALLRPMGFYGGMIGCILGALLALPLGIDLWIALGALCVAAPWVQGIGRLRCFVQGCCHGRETLGDSGIRYTHPRTRVCRLTTFSGVAIHATQLYSILWNALTGAALIRLLFLRSSAGTICAAYLILSGMGRFVEEAYRGEPQTKIIFGLRFYQWAAIASIIAGAIIMTVPGTAAMPAPHFRGSSAELALFCAVAAWFVCGVDFPESSRRFARLT